MDFTEDENFWACTIGLLVIVLYRTGIDQMVVQRYLAARTLQEAQRTACWGTAFLLTFFILVLAMAFSLIYWFRDCDPQLSGAIKQLDQLLPFYVKKHLAEYPGFAGLFLAGVVCAATSTISSMINSQATVLYIDVVARFVTLTEAKSTQVTKYLGMI
ncbi:putative sodium-dependent multivitamin transporter [Ixodes scapularis]|uniref:putative sodium-dependent multivitamin transporter n=1 Tax=Ixodes scapularis TaxID=6945 RepID=UPI001A9F611B|nr:putative sodium-dependent multivitamin transporter [Ixodes scapularis]